MNLNSTQITSVSTNKLSLTNSTPHLGDHTVEASNSNTKRLPQTSPPQFLKQFQVPFGFDEARALQVYALVSKQSHGDTISNVAKLQCTLSDFPEGLKRFLAYHYPKSTEASHENSVAIPLSKQEDIASIILILAELHQHFPQLSIEHSDVLHAIISHSSNPARQLTLCKRSPIIYFAEAKKHPLHFNKIIQSGGCIAEDLNAIALSSMGSPLLIDSLQKFPKLFNALAGKGSLLALELTLAIDPTIAEALNNDPARLQLFQISNQTTISEYFKILRKMLPQTN